MCRISSILSLVLISVVIILFLQTPCIAGEAGIKDIGIVPADSFRIDSVFFSTPFLQTPVVVITAKCHDDHAIIICYMREVELHGFFLCVYNLLNSDVHVLIHWIALDAGTSGITLNEAVTPSHISLSQNSPNPSMGITKIRYEIAKQSFVTLKIYDGSGNLVKTLIEGKQEAGNYAPTWMGEDNYGRKVINGSYFYILNVDGKQTSRKAIILK